MKCPALVLLGLALAVLLVGCVSPIRLVEMTPVTAVPSCPVTAPNGSTPPYEDPSPYHHGNGALWTGLWPDGTVLIQPEQVEPDGSLGMKFWWWRGVPGALTITGRRLDGEAPPLRAHIPEGYGDIGFQATGLIFATEGCWEVTGSVGNDTLTFVTRVVKVPASS